MVSNSFGPLVRVIAVLSNDLIQHPYFAVKLEFGMTDNPVYFFNLISRIYSSRWAPRKAATIWRASLDKTESAQSQWVDFTRWISELNCELLIPLCWAQNVERFQRSSWGRTTPETDTLRKDIMYASNCNHFCDSIIMHLHRALLKNDFKIELYCQYWVLKIIISAFMFHKSMFNDKQ